MHDPSSWCSFSSRWLWCWLRAVPSQPGKPAQAARVTAATLPATATAVPPTATSLPTATAIPLTATSLPTATAIPPTATSTPAPTETPMPTSSVQATATVQPTAAATATPDAAIVKVNADIINVRSGPGTAYPVTGRLDGGATQKIVGKSEDGKWWQIATKEGNGWVAGELVTAGGPMQGVAVVKAAPPPTAAPQAQAAAAAVGDPRRGRREAVPSATASRSIRGAIAGPPRCRQEHGFQLGQVPVAMEGLRRPTRSAQLAGRYHRRSQRQRAERPGQHRQSARLGAARQHGPQRRRSAGRSGTYASFVGEFAARYCGRVQAIEVWNEQNLDYEWGREPLDPARYVRLLAAAYGAIKRACPSTVVVSGALTPTGAPPPVAMDDFTYLERMYQAGLANYADAIGAHPSGFNVAPDVPGGAPACDFIRGQGSFTWGRAIPRTIRGASARRWRATAISCSGTAMGTSASGRRSSAGPPAGRGSRDTVRQRQHS